MTPGPGHNMVAMASEKVRYSCFAMSRGHKNHLLAFTKMAVMKGMIDPKHSLYDKEVGAVLGSVKLPEPVKKDAPKDIPKKDGKEQEDDAKKDGKDEGDGKKGSKRPAKDIGGSAGKKDDRKDGKRPAKLTLEGGDEGWSKLSKVWCGLLSCKC